MRVARIYYLAGDFEPRLSEADREAVLRWQEERNLFYQDAKTLQAFLKSTARDSLPFSTAWLTEFLELMTRRARCGQGDDMARVVEALMKEGATFYAGIARLAVMLGNEGESSYPRAVIEHALLRRLTRSFGTRKQKNEEPPMPDSFIFDAPPRIIFNGRGFCFTGKFAYGSRKDCTAAIEQRGGRWHDNMTAAVDYLVVADGGENTAPDGGKARAFWHWRSAGHLVQMIPEELWTKNL